ncbi:MAG: branched-chain amino acid ABC transporter permease [Acetobacteraceae bacterium]
MLDLVNFYLIPGLVLGAIYAMSATGLSLIYGVMRFAHFAHGDLMALGAYVALAASRAFGLSAWAAIPFAAAATVPAALLADSLFYARLRRSLPAVLLISSFGTALMLRALIYLLFGPTPVTFDRPLVPPLLVGGLRIQMRHVWIILGAAVAAALLHLLLSRTRAGRAMRAMSDDPDLARITGVATDAVIRLTWTVAAILVAVAGVFLGVDTQLQPVMGFHVLLASFAAAILGGIGRPWGAAFGGLILGIAEELSSFPVLDGAPLLEPTYKSAVAFAVLVATLIVRPQGLFRGMI